MSSTNSAGASGNGTHTDTAQHPAPMRHRVPLWAVWFGVVGAPAAWSMHLLTSYALSAHTCYPRLVPLAAPELNGATLQVLLLSIFGAAISLSVYALVTSVRSWRATVGESAGDTHEALDIGDGRTRFMALCGILISALFLTAVLAQGVVLVTVQPCV